MDDFAQISPELSDKTCVDLARAMGFNEFMIYFFENMFDLKFEGMYFSENHKSNKIKCYVFKTKFCSIR